MLSPYRFQEHRNTVFADLARQAEHPSVSPQKASPSHSPVAEMVVVPNIPAFREATFCVATLTRVPGQSSTDSGKHLRAPHRAVIHTDEIHPNYHDPNRFSIASQTRGAEVCAVIIA